MIDPVSSSRRLALDTSIFIYHFEAQTEFTDVARSVLSTVHSGNVNAIFSIVGVLELVTKPLRERDLETADWYEGMLRAFPNLSIAGIDFDLARSAARIRGDYRFPTPDALHLATALYFRADTFITNDRRLQQFRELPVTLLSDFVH